MKKLIARFIHEDEGQDLIEYILIASFVSAGALAGAGILGGSLNSWYEDAGAWVDTAAGQLAPLFGMGLTGLPF